MCLKEKDREGLLGQLQASAQQKGFFKTYIHPVFAAAHTDAASKAVKTPSLPALPAHVSTKISFVPILIMSW